MAVHAAFWSKKRVFLTGHTGFKGSWLSLWLQNMGAEVCGFAIEPPTTPNLFTTANVSQGMRSTMGDIRDYESVHRAMQLFNPEIVIHMAAQPLVRLSYKEPVLTYSTNVMGTVHVLEAARNVANVRAIINVTTDKCYENKEWVWAYRENEPMGGYDPYSNSKGCSELVTSAYRQSYFTSDSVAVATARAGNVIGGGDWAEDRLIPDILRAFEMRKPVNIRNPSAIRPWQHVLEPLSGYLMLAQHLCSDEGQKYAQAWNFGPNEDDVKPVQWIVEQLANNWGNGATWQMDNALHPHEAHYLKLDISKAKTLMQWTPTWELEEALKRINEWHHEWRAQKDMQQVCLRQIAEFSQSMNGIV